MPARTRERPGEFGIDFVTYMNGVCHSHHNANHVRHMVAVRAFQGSLRSGVTETCGNACAHARVRYELGIEFITFSA